MLIIIHVNTLKIFCFEWEPKPQPLLSEQKLFAIADDLKHLLHPSPGHYTLHLSMGNETLLLYAVNSHATCCTFVTIVVLAPLVVPNIFALSRNWTYNPCKPGRCWLNFPTELPKYLLQLDTGYYIKYIIIMYIKMNDGEDLISRTDDFDPHLTHLQYSSSAVTSCFSTNKLMIHLLRLLHWVATFHWRSIRPAFVLFLHMWLDSSRLQLFSRKATQSEFPFDGCANQDTIIS